VWPFSNLSLCRSLARAPHEVLGSVVVFDEHGRALPVEVRRRGDPEVRLLGGLITGNGKLDGATCVKDPSLLPKWT